MKYLRVAVGFALILCLEIGCQRFSTAAEKSANSTQSPPLVGPISSADVRPHVHYLADPKLEGRGTEHGKQLTRDYLEKQYADMGLQPLFASDSYVQAIPGKRSSDGSATVRGYNLGAWLPGSDPKLRDELIIISAHYDHLGIRQGRVYPGADDNASSMAMVLEVARAMSKLPQPPRRSVVFLNFDLEENMLWGSRWFVAHPPWPPDRVKLFITADLLGRSLGNLPLHSVFVFGSEYAPQLRDVLQHVGEPQDLRVDRLGVDLIGTRSDYGPFRDRRIPFLFFSTGEHPDYHTTRDTADRINYEQLARVSNLVLRIAETVADDDQPPAWSSNPQLDFNEVEALHRITQKILDADEAQTLQLGDVQRFFVSNIHTKIGSILERGNIRPDERPWLIRSAQFLLLTVF